MKKTTLLLLGAVVFGGVSFADTVPCNSGSDISNETIQENVAGLKDTLEKGLRLRRPEEFAFANRVVLLVQTNRLTRKLVLETFSYARYKLPYPYPYFERAMRLRAAKVGVNL